MSQKLIGKIAVLIFMVFPIMALLYAKTAETLWGWFLESQYGNGPTTAAWVGGIYIVSLINTKYTTDSKEEAEISLLASTLIRFSFIVLVCCFVLLSAWFAKNVAGW